MDSSFRRAPCTQPLREMQCLSKLLSKYQQNLSLRLSEGHSMKEAMNSSFRRALCTKAIFNKKYWQNVSVRLSQSRLIKALYERRNGQLLSQSTMYYGFCQQKFHPRWSFCEKKSTALSIFAKKLVVWLGFTKVCENSTFKQISTLSV